MVPRRTLTKLVLTEFVQFLKLEMEFLRCFPPQETHIWVVMILTRYESELKWPILTSCIDYY